MDLDWDGCRHAGTPMLAVSTWNKFQDILSDQQITKNSCEGV